MLLILVNNPRYYTKILYSCNSDLIELKRRSVVVNRSLELPQLREN